MNICNEHYCEKKSFQSYVHVYWYRNNIYINVYFIEKKARLEVFQTMI